MGARQNKYNVAPASERRYNSVLYHSKAEMLRASQLDLLTRAGNIYGWARQCQVQLGPDFRSKVDFVVWYPSGAIVEEVKGVETADFKTVLRLWPKYGPCEMHVGTLTSKGWKWKLVEGRDTNGDTA